MRALSIMLLVSFLLQSCSPTFYAPGAHFVPGIRSKGEKVLSVNGTSSQANIQYAQGITDRLAVQTSLSGMYINHETNELAFDGDRVYGALAEAGLGYYKDIGDGFRFELYGLGSAGRMGNHFRSGNNEFLGTYGDLTANIYRLGIQPSLGFSNHWLSITGAFRWSSLHYDNIKGILVADASDQRALLQSRSNSSLFESSVTAQIGGKRLRFQIQMVDSRNLRYDDFPMRTSNLLVGMQYRFR